MDTLGERLARSERAAFAELYDSCAVRVHQYLTVRLGMQADADDVLQETFVRLARDRRKLARLENPVAYVFGVARNEATRLVERRMRENRRRSAFASENLVPEGRTTELQEREAHEQISALLDRLEPPLREIVELKIYAALTLREISEIMGLPQGTVATRYRTALEKMRGQLVKEAE